MENSHYLPFQYLDTVGNRKSIEKEKSFSNRPKILVWTTRSDLD